MVGGVSCIGGDFNQTPKKLRTERPKITLKLDQVVSVALLVARRTNNRKVVGSMSANVVCITADR